MKWTDLFDESQDSQSLKASYKNLFSAQYNEQTTFLIQKHLCKLLSTIEEKEFSTPSENIKLQLFLRHFLLTELYASLSKYKIATTNSETEQSLNLKLEGSPFFFNYPTLHKKLLAQLASSLTVKNQSTENGIHYQWITLEESLDLYGSGCGGDGETAQKPVVSAMAQEKEATLKKMPTLFILPGDSVYPTISLKTTADDIHSQFSIYRNLKFTVTAAALGNHESGAITDNLIDDAAQGDQSLLLKRRDHAAAIINHHVICHPYYHLSVQKYGEKTPYLDILIIDSTTLHFDIAQQTWLKNTVSQLEGRNIMLVSHHAIGETLGKRNLKSSERHLYGPYKPEGKAEFIGNQHQVLAEVFRNLGLLEQLKNWTSLVAHDHFLAAMNHPIYGQVIISGGGSTEGRTESIYTLPGQQFPPISIQNQKTENQKAKRAGFTKIEIREGRLLTFSLIGAKKNILLYQRRYDDPAIRETPPLAKLKEEVEKILKDYYIQNELQQIVNQLLRPFSIFKLGHQHNERAMSLANSIKAARNLSELKGLIEKQIKLIDVSLVNSSDRATSSETDEMKSKKETAAPSSSPPKHEEKVKSPTHGDFYKQLLLARAFLSQFDILEVEEEETRCLAPS